MNRNLFLMSLMVIFLGVVPRWALAEDTSAETAAGPSGEAPAEVSLPADTTHLEARKAAELQEQNTWDQPAPKVEVSKWGQELKIVVTPDAKMKKDNLLAIQSVKLETEKGDFLGLKTYSPKETTRAAEFMLNPEVLKIENVKITVSSSKNGDWVTIAPLKVEEAAPAPGKAVEEKKESPAQAPQAPVPAAKPGRSSKKGWLW